MDSDNKIILEQIIESSRTKEKWNNHDRQKLKDLRGKLGSATEVAHALGIAAQTLFFWEKQESQENELRSPPPERQLRKLSDLIARKHMDSLKPLFYEVLMRMRDYDDIRERANLCDELWTLRAGKPFAVGNNPETFNLMVEYMKGNTVNYNFVYVKPNHGSDPKKRIFRAMDSYNALEKKLTSIPKVISKRIHGVPIPENQANELGLTDPWISFAMAEYSAEGREKYQKSVDVWMEFIFDVTKDPQAKQEQFVWLELPAAEAESWREKRIVLLEECKKAKAS